MNLADEIKTLDLFFLSKYVSWTREKRGTAENRKTLKAKITVLVRKYY